MLILLEISLNFLPDAICFRLLTVDDVSPVPNIPLELEPQPHKLSLVSIANVEFTPVAIFLNLVVIAIFVGVFTVEVEPVHNL